MAEEKNNNSNLAAKSAQAANTVRGAVKTGKAIAGAAKGAAAGGPYGAVAGLVWGNRHLIGKIILITVLILLLPILFILMLPALIFGGLVDAFTPDDPTVPVLNDSAYITENMTEITNSVSNVLSEALEDVLVEIEDDFSSSGADQREIINPHENAPAYNANAFVSQFCASKNEDFESITFDDMESTLRNAKGELYSFTSKEETRTRVETTVTVDASTGKETETSTTVTEDWMVYTIVYNGEDYFADNVFHLNAEQKELSNNYAQNLSVFWETECSSACRMDMKLSVLLEILNLPTGRRRLSISTSSMNAMPISLMGRTTSEATAAALPRWRLSFLLLPMRPLIR